MELEGLAGRFLRISEVITRMAYVNLLWILFTILGLGIFGFMPATVALFTVTRKWVMGDRDIPVFKTFWTTYRKEFFKSTLFGVVLFVIGYIIYIDLAFSPTGGLFTLLRIALFLCGVLYVVLLLYIFPIYVHYDWSKRLYIKYALLIGISYPHYTFILMAGIVALYYLCISVPGIIPFFSVSLLSYMMMWFVYKVIRKIELTQSIGKDKGIEAKSVEA
ncbi:YesL family protein [Sporosarcina beigongshangi]|uniref:YesL family protein n=1 Tax=Sporosarcina beigongshangi TaxID=2782538 RepID=UPI001939599D|nr:YesL family protein [Sporosarcina beigongshangi]